MQANPAGSSPQALGFLALTCLQSLTKKLSLKARLGQGCLAALGLLQPFHDGRQQDAGPIHERHSLEVGIQIAWVGSPHADRVNPWGGKAKQVVENDGMERRAQLSHPL